MKGWRNFSNSFFFDFGSETTRVLSAKRELLAEQPSMMAALESSGALLAYPDTIRAYEGKKIAGSSISSYVQDGLIASESALSSLLTNFGPLFSLSLVSAFLRPTAVIGIPLSSTPAYEKAIGQVFTHHGFSEPHFVPFLLAFAHTHGHLGTSVIADCGAGKVDIAIVKDGKIKAQVSDTTGGNYLNLLIIAAIKEQIGTEISVLEAARIKSVLGTARRKQEGRVDVVRGKDMRSGRPVSKRIDQTMIAPACQRYVSELRGLLQLLFLDVEPTDMEHVIERGVTLIGGGSLLDGLDEELSAYFSMPVSTTDRAMIAPILSLPSMVGQERKEG